MNNKYNVVEGKLAVILSASPSQEMDFVGFTFFIRSAVAVIVLLASKHNKVQLLAIYFPRLSLNYFRLARWDFEAALVTLLLYHLSFVLLGCLRV